MRDLYVVTHTEATHVTDGLVGGWHDSALTPRGEQDAEMVAEALAERVTDRHSVALFSSDLRRARQTAAPIAARLGVDAIIDPGWRERSYGAAEGQPAGSMPYSPPPVCGDRLTHQDGLGSETRIEWANRVYAAFDRALERGASTSIVVTHGGSATHVIAAWIGMPVEATGYVKFRMGPGGITHLHEDDFFHDRQVVSLNDVSHLRP